MNPDPRPYRGEQDLQAMHALLMAGTAAQSRTHYVHPGDVDWWLFYPPLDGELWDGLYLWDDPGMPGRLLAWALIVPGQTFDMFAQPELRGTPLAAEMRLWAEGKLIEETRRIGKDKISVFWVSEGDDDLNPWLLERGYAVASRDVFMRCDLEALPDPACLEGYSVRSCRGLEEAEARARAQYGAFASTAPFDRYVDRFSRFMRSPAYVPERDVVVAAADGRIGAFCITWLDPRNRIGLCEPVGTHPDFQRKGLGKAVMAEALLRLKVAGMQHAVLCTGEDNLAAIRLYESVGFRVVDRIGFFKKQI